MLSELGVSAILEASITGAGLVLAVYALLTPLSSRIFERRAKLLGDKIKEFEATKNKLSPESPSKEIKKLKDLQDVIKQFKIMPVYYKMEYILLPFMLYLTSVFISLFYLENFNGKPSAFNDTALLYVFYTANVTFLTLGFVAIVGVYSVMKEEFETVKEKQKEVKEASVNLSEVASVSVHGEAEVKEKKNS